ncbi:MAG: hypothetical protein JO076_00165 [Verrucomicrobia bacterium]|nr:hypothetical protein [Verrucomicrobiota bacterium]
MSKNAELDESESITQTSLSQKNPNHFRSLQAKMEYLKEQGKLKAVSEHNKEGQREPQQQLKNEESTGTGLRQS